MADMTGQTPSLPTGGGALTGIGETFQPDLHTGTGNLTVPINLPPGRGTLTPQLSLTYSSGTGNGAFGLGWAMPVPKITRRTDKGVPAYDDDLDAFVLSGAEDLVPVPLGSGAPPDLPVGATAHRYRPRTEAAFARIVHVTGADTDYWDVWTPDGLRNRYGTQRRADSATEWADPGAIRSPQGRVFSWLLTETRDTFGNHIAYTYSDDGGPQRYLSTMSYADYADPAAPSYAVTVTLRYDLSPRPDPFTDRKPGFALTTSRRVVAVDVSTVGSGGSPTTTVDLAYSDDNGLSLLRSIQVVGRDGSTGAEQKLPPLTFGYRDWDPARRQYRSLSGPLPPGSLGTGMDLVDLFADGLPSVIELDGTARYWRNRGGSFDRPRALAGAPTGAALGAPGTLMSDLDGDGRPELAVSGGVAAFVWHLKDPSADPINQAGFAAPTVHGTIRGSIDPTGPGVRLVDLTGTHVPDLLVSATVPLTATGDGRGGFTDLRPLLDPPAPATDLADPRVHLADMTGDGLTDLVMVHDGAVRYWPNLGHGRFDQPVDMTSAPRFEETTATPGVGFDPRRLLLGDLTGDGTADAVYIADGTTTIWLNRSGIGFAPPTVIRGTPRVSDATSIRLADIDGVGVAGILWTGVGAGDGWAFLDPTGGVKPYLLTDIDNHHGGTTTLIWSTSTAFATTDRDAGQPWRTTLPFPVHVLASTETRDYFAHTLLTERYRYHEGYWDPIDREFRGFSRVEHTDTLTTTRPAAAAPPTIIRLDPLTPTASVPTGFDPAAHGNLLGNWSFDLPADAGPTTLTTTDASPTAAGLSSAAGWSTWNNVPATTTTTLQSSTLPHGAGGMMLHVTATAAGCGIVQTFLPPDDGPRRAVASVWVQVVAGSIQIGTGNGGNTSADAVYADHGQWALVEAGNTQTPANEFVIYSADPAGADFYVDHAWVRADDTPSDPATSLPVRTVTWFHPGPVGPVQGPWVVPDSSDDYWLGDPPLGDEVDLSGLPADMPRPALREALRGLRGLVLRTETYSDDSQAALSRRPYEVHDATHQVVPVLDGRTVTDPGWLARPVVAVRTVLSRTAAWDRGTEPMMTLTATGGFDEYGRAQVTATAAVPRGRDPRSPGPPCLASTSRLEYATRDDGTLFRLDCVCLRTRHEAVDPGTTSVSDFLAAAFAGGADGALLALELTYYDGIEFVGLPYGQIGEHGLHSRAETLIVTPDLLTQITQPLVAGGPTAQPIPYLPADGSALLATWGTDYPDAFRDAVINAPASRGPALGYLWHDDTTPFAAGYYTQTSRTRYEVQQPTSGTTPRGLPIASLDPFGGLTTTTWDDHQLLIVTTTDPAGLTNVVDYDYRILKPSQITDPNANQSAAGYTPLGLPAWSARTGKAGQRDGDTVEQPAQLFTYNLTAWDDAALAGTEPQPMSVTTIKRIDHRWTLVARADATRGAAGQPPMTDAEIAAMFGPTEHLDHPDRFIQVIEFSDGHGRSLQTRTQADDLIVSNVGLPFDATPAAGTITLDPPSIAPRVVVSAWKIYDNKSRPIVTYEPFYANGYTYLEPTEPELAQLAKLRHHYDPRGRPTTTIAPDGSQTRTVHGVPARLSTPDDWTPTPWERYIYDPADNAPRTHPSLALEQVDHWNTPSSVVLDPLGRIIQTTERGLAADVTTAQSFDIDGHLLSVVDPLGRQSAEHRYDLAGHEWLSWLLDAGAIRTVRDADGGIAEYCDDRGARNMTAFDAAHRTTTMWASDRSGQVPTYRHRVIYGDEPGTGLTNEQAAATNVLGRVVTILDEAGRIRTSSYSLDGNPVGTTRQFISNERLLSNVPPSNSGSWEGSAYAVDWPDPEQSGPGVEALLDPVSYTTQNDYDALGRLIATIRPTDVTDSRASVAYSYGKGGGIVAITVDGVPYMHFASYDAHGRVALAFLGNGLLHRYSYDPTSLQRRRAHVRHATPSTDSQGWICDGQAIRDHTYRHDLIGHVLTIADHTPGCGIPPADPDSLTRQFTFDPLGRLATATGRETDNLPPAPWLDVPRTTDITKARAYQEQYTYDQIGNLLQLDHKSSAFGAGAYGRTFTVPVSGNQLTSFTVGTLALPYIYDAAGNLVSSADNRHFEWDHAGRLITFRDQAGNSEPSVWAQYRYDTQGQRLLKVVRRSSGPTEVILYLSGFERTIRISAGEVISYDRVYATSGDLSAEIVRGSPLPDDPLGEHSVRYELMDHLGSVAATVSIDGTVLNREEYLPFGETSFGSFSSKRYRFTKKQRDEESGLSYHGARYLAPWIGRWISCDPAGPVDGPSTYAYARNDPLGFVDHSGKSANSTEQKSWYAHVKELWSPIKAFNTGRDAGIRAGYTATDLERAQAVLDFLKKEAAGGQSPSAAATVVRSASAARNLARTDAQAGLSLGGKFMSKLMEKDRDWPAIINKYGDPTRVSPGDRFPIAEKIGTKIGATNSVMTALSKVSVGIGAATAGWKIGTGIDEMMDSKTGLGALDVAEGSTNLGLMAMGLSAGKAGLLTSAVASQPIATALGARGAALLVGTTGFLATVGAAGGVSLAFNSARSAATGERSWLEVADAYYGTGFSNIYAWQERSTAARVGLAVASMGLSEVWHGLNKWVE